MIWASLTKNGAKKSVGSSSERASTGRIRSPSASIVLKYATIIARMPSWPAGHWLRPRNGVPATTSGCAAPRSWLMKKLSLKLGRVALWTVEARCMLWFTGR